MKTLTSLSAAIVIAASLSAPAHAQLDGFGVGIVAGDPTGLCFKGWLSSKSAIEVAAAWSFEGDGGFFLATDYVLHALNIVDDPDADLDGLMFTYGLGGKLVFLDNEANGAGDGDDDIVLGVRVPLGLCYPFEGAPVDLFVQLAPVMDIVPETELGLNGGIGARLYF